jgi:SAM-dependent methyltransferase
MSDPLPIPWTEAYEERRNRVLRAAVFDERLLADFAGRAPLPAGYGRGLDERCVEYPWAVAHVPDGSGRVLDAGSALNHEFLLALPVLRQKHLHIVTLAPEAECFWQQGVSYLFEDLRALPFADGIYDLVICISTIEHVGCDNTYYTGSRTTGGAGDGGLEAAAREICRVVRPGGRLLLTVPFGRYQHHGAFQQFDRLLLSRLVASMPGMTIDEESFYHYTSDGWQLSTDTATADVEYVAWVSELMRTGRRPEPLVHEPDGAAAARAVACLALTKR